ncbi:hypothetical protein SAMN05216439_0203 [Methanobrevibacter gottschalkii]|uniref:Uncharacterized protein n=2 Tax=Methanobrevibacter gottschalkii TaxID=190974 RepID=A0A3N5BMU8_9EURY|nr:hypothetical protein EDC42_1683 [Methanobrevibacter gottschalkii DSM 11977]SEL22529.1 hypothetical protein SAMN05216439_0203 [Methanobrevibacter gottschalkii]
MSNIVYLYNYVLIYIYVFYKEIHFRHIKYFTNRIHSKDNDSMKLFFDNMSKYLIFSLILLYLNELNLIIIISFVLTHINVYAFKN